MALRHLLALAIILFIGKSGLAVSVKDGYEALRIYNYFEAKRIFQKKIGKSESPCSFGLATIYYRRDNPFHQLDSAFKYVLKAEKSFPLVKEKLRKELESYEFSELNIFELKRKISSEYFLFTAKKNTETAYQKFLDTHPWANERFIALHRRDSIAFYKAMQENTSLSFQAFIKKYPESEYTRLAQDEVYLKEYEERTAGKTLAEYMLFLEERPDSPYVMHAENEIYRIQTRINTIASYYNFIVNFPENRNVDLAWRKLFQTYMYTYTDERIEAFKREYPDYPFQDELNEEMSLAKQILLPYKSENYFGWMTDQGQVMTDATYESLSLYKEGLAQASRFGKVGFVDKNNKVVIPFEYDSASDFEDGRAIVEKNGKVGIIDRSGKFIFDIVFGDIGLYSEGLVFAKKDSLFAYYDKFGNQIVAERFEEAFSFQNGVAQVVIGGYENFIDRLGNVLFPLKYETVKRLTDNLFVFQEGNYFGLMTAKGNEIQPAKYEEIATLSENRIAFSLNGKIGYFDQYGIQAVAPIFDARPNISNFANFTAGYARAISKNKWGIIDPAGKWVITPAYQALGEISDLVAFRKDLLWGYIDLNNKVIVPPTYDEARSFDNEVAIVSFNNRYGMLNNKGTIVLPIIFDHVQKLNDKLYLQRNGDKLTLLNKDGQALTTETYDQVRFLNKEYLILNTAFEVHYFYLPEMRLIRPDR